MRVRGIQSVVPVAFKPYGGPFTVDILFAPPIGTASLRLLALPLLASGDCAISRSANVAR